MIVSMAVSRQYIRRNLIMRTKSCYIYNAVVLTFSPIDKFIIITSLKKPNKGPAKLDQSMGSRLR